MISFTRGYQYDIHDGESANLKHDPIIFRLLHWLDLQIAPTAVNELGGQAVYTTHRLSGYPAQDVVSLHV
jgi:hypothetical protein